MQRSPIKGLKYLLYVFIRHIFPQNGANGAFFVFQLARPFKDRGKIQAQARKIRFRGGGRRHHDIIIPVFDAGDKAARDLFYPALDLIPHHAFADLLAGDDPYMQSAAGAVIYERHIPARRTAAFGIDIRKSAPATEAILLLHTLRGQLFPALVAAPCEHVPAAFACHSLAEAVHFAALPLLRLISSFHSRNSSLL